MAKVSLDKIRNIGKCNYEDNEKFEILDTDEDGIYSCKVNDIRYFIILNSYKISPEIITEEELINKDINNSNKHIDTTSAESYDYDDVLSRDISTLKEARERFEKDFIIKALKKNDKNITITSKELGVERTNLHRKIKLYSIDVEKI